MAGTDKWIDPRLIKKAEEELGWKERVSLPTNAERPQQHVAERLLKGNKNLNTCGNCTSAFRRKDGVVMCGNLRSGYQGYEIKKPFEFGCRSWKLRRKEQPPVFKDPKRNKQLARYVDWVERGPFDKGMDVDPRGKPSKDVKGFR